MLIYLILNGVYFRGSQVIRETDEKSNNKTACSLKLHAVSFYNSRSFVLPIEKSVEGIHR